VIVIAAVIVSIALLAVVSLGVGEYPISPGRVVATLLGGGDPREALVVHNLRLPRTSLALVAGAALAVAGAVTQTTARNALASPDLLGVTAGAGAGAVAAIVFGGAGGEAIGGLLSLGAPVSALAGGLLAAAVVGVLLRIGGGRGLRPVLLGVAVSAFFSSLTSWMLVEASLDDVERATAWLTGSLSGRGWTEVLTVSITLAAASALLVPVARGLAALQLGPDTARALGTPIPLTVGTLLGASVLLTSVTVSAVGPIGFVALVAPHLASLASRTPRPPLIVSGLFGALILLASDLAARTVIPSFTVPTGAVTALVGAPFLVWLLVRSTRTP